MNLSDLKRNWDAYGRIDPLWAILNFPDKKGKRWSKEEFFATGTQEIKEVMQHIASLGISLPRTRALDFGCGVGRLTQALTDYFDTVIGVDIAPSMIQAAQQHNLYPDRCTYYVNKTDDLKQFSDNMFDFIYTNITLQHMNPVYAMKYIRELVRVLNPQGLLCFQLPSHKTGYDLVYLLCPSVIRRALKRIVCAMQRQPVIDIYSIRRSKVIRFLQEAGARLRDVKETSSAGRRWRTFMYCVTKG